MSTTTYTHTGSSVLNAIALPIETLREKIRHLRRDILRQVYAAQSGHPGGSLSCIDIVASIYYRYMRFDPSNPSWAERDRFVLSKGHSCPAQYAVLADLGFFPYDWLYRFRDITGELQGHPDPTTTPGVEVFTGSLGQGTSSSLGMALGQNMDSYGGRTFTIVGDGECQEGQVWEAFMAAPNKGARNWMVFMDRNGLQIDGNVDDINSLGDVPAKMRAFGWFVDEIDGHNLDEIDRVIREFVTACAAGTRKQPTFIHCRTHKGQGVSFMTDNYGWHGIAPNKEQFLAAIAELGFDPAEEGA